MSRTIVHALAPAPVGGLETVVRLLAQGQRDRGHHVVVVAVIDTPAHPFVDRMRAAQIPVQAIVAPGRAYRYERREFARILRDVRPSVVHTHGYRSDIMDLTVARALAIPSVSTLHGFTSGDWKVRLYERIQLRILRKSSAVIAVSRGVLDRATAYGIARNRLHVIPNAYAPAEYADQHAARAQLGLSDETKNFVWIGRLSYEKGADVLVDAMPYLSDSNVTVTVLGDGPERAAIEARARETNMKLRFLGRVDNAARLLPAFDGCILSSRLEGTPMVLLEAMAARVPIIATHVGGIPDMLSEREARLVSPEAPDALATAMREVAADSIAAEQRAECAYARWNRDYAIAPWIDRHDALYQSIQPSLLSS